MNRRNFLKAALIGSAAITTWPIITATESISTSLLGSAPSAIEWINNNVKIESSIHGTIPFKLTDKQIHYLQCVEKSNVPLFFKCARRQEGYTTASAAYILYRMIHDTDSNFLCICNSLDQCNHFMRIIRVMYNNLPNQMSVVKSYSCDRYTIYINSNMLKMNSVRNTPTTICNGYAMKLIFLQDFEFYQNKKSIIESAYYSLSTNSKLVGYSL